MNEGTEEKKRSKYIDQLPSGRWRVRVPSGQGQMTWGTFDTEAIAEREVVKALKVSNDMRRDYEGLTVNALGQKVLTRREVKNEVRDPASDWSRWDKHIKPHQIGKLGVAKVQPKHVYQWLSTLYDSNLSAQTVRHCRNLLSVVLGEAVHSGILKSNPVAEVKMRGHAKQSALAGWTYLVPDEQVKVINAADYPDRCLVAFAIGSAMRAGELAALRRSDLDVEGKRIMVRFGGPPDQPTKTGHVRVIPLLGPALEAARAWLRDVPARDGCEAVFPQLVRKWDRKRLLGGYRDPNHILPYKTWRAILKKAGITRRVRWHDLRHTGASSLVSGWWGRPWSLHEVMNFLGHTSIDLTQRYAHLCPGALVQAASQTPGGQVTLVTTPPELPPPEGPTVPYKNSPIMHGAGHGDRTRDLRLGKSKESQNSPADPCNDLDMTWAARTALAALHGGRVPDELGA